MAMNVAQKECFDKANDLNLRGLAEGIEQQADHPELYTPMDFYSRLTELLQQQADFEQMRVYDLRRRNAHFEDYVPLSKIHIDPERGVSQGVIDKIKSMQWFRNTNNVLVSGKTGTGKTALLTAIGLELCRHGYAVRYFHTSDLLDEMKSLEPAKVLAYRKRLKRFNALILDDFALRNFDARDIDLLFHIAEDRYGKGVLLLGTQLDITGIIKALNFIPGATSNALIDRITNPMYSIGLEGASLRGVMPNTVSEKIAADAKD